LNASFPRRSSHPQGREVTMQHEPFSQRQPLIDLSLPVAGVDVAKKQLGEINRQQIAKLAGLAPLNCDSGAHRGQRRIRGGRQAARTCLYMAAFNARQKCPRFKQFFDGLINRGKRCHVAMTACMRKLLVVLNQMIKSNTHWNQKISGALT
jgi:hypothetical protein